MPVSRSRKSNFSRISQQFAVWYSRNSNFFLPHIIRCLLLFDKFGFTTLTIRDYLAVGAILSATDSVVHCRTSVLLQPALLGTFLYPLLHQHSSWYSSRPYERLYHKKHSTLEGILRIVKLLFMLLMAYLSYMLAELLSLSGILTIFFCGIVMSHYTWHNVTESSRITTKHAFATISFVAETFIFLYVGMDALDIDKWKASDASPGTSVGVSSMLFALVLIGRAAFIFPIANISNCFKKRENKKIEFRSQFIMWWAGLMRGAVTIALSYNQVSFAYVSSSPNCSRYLVHILITVVFGSITKPLIEAVLLRHAKPNTNISDATDIPSLEDLRLLFLETGDPSEEGSGEPSRKRNSFRLLMTHTSYTVHHFWRKFDDKFMRPVFGGRGFVPFVPGSPSGAVDDGAIEEEQTP
ncbi:hypothetical protein M0R45_028321 [Rubus argutus]|uniref:Cation/H+ exchanger transmembrane domain-containing protein n=1 Tax=Rubus argutus TaxID=59490 RepID=A0AAW1W4C4_RUBAR